MTSSEMPQHGPVQIEFTDSAAELIARRRWPVIPRVGDKVELVPEGDAGRAPTLYRVGRVIYSEHPETYDLQITVILTDG